MMKITKSTALTGIQQAFSAVFPHLRIEFYRTAHGKGEGSAEQEKLDPQMTIQQVAPAAAGNDLAFDPDMQISAFEDAMLTGCGLSVQVFRRSGNLWLQTTRTDTWTLSEANRKGGHSRELFEDQQG